MQDSTSPAPQHDTACVAEPRDAAPRMPRWAARGFLCIVLIQLMLTAYLACWYSPTLDEVAQLPAGLALYRYGRTDLYRVNPPLVRLVAAWPVLWQPHREDWSDAVPNSSRRVEWRVGADFVQANGVRSYQLFMMARWACLPFAVLGTWVCWRWGSQVFGPAGGLAAALLWGFSPNVLGHGSLVTCDIPATSCGLLAAWRFAAWLEDECWRNVVWAGLSLGLALLTKTYWLMLLGWWPLLAVMFWFRQTPPRRSAGLVRMAQLLVVMVLGLNLLNLGYGFQGTGRTLGSYQFYSRALSGSHRDLALDAGGNRWADHWLGRVWLPFPSDYITGIDLQKHDFEVAHVSYLLGEVRQGGWWSYYIVGLLVKVPLAVWVLVLLGGLTARRDPDWRRRWWVLLPLWGPALTLLVLASAQTGMGRHVRYVFPMLPVLCLLAAEVFTVRSRPWAWGLVAAAVLESVIWFPGSLSFRQVLAELGHRNPPVLADSNLDWGQDLRLAGEWVRNHPECQPVSIAAVSGFPIRAVGIDVPSTPAGKAVPGWHLISKHLLYVPENSYAAYRKLRPVGRVGSTFNIYHVPEEFRPGR